MKNFAPDFCALYFYYLVTKIPVKNLGKKHGSVIHWKVCHQNQDLALANAFVITSNNLSTVYCQTIYGKVNDTYNQHKTMSEAMGLMKKNVWYIASSWDVGMSLFSFFCTYFSFQQFFSFLSIFCSWSRYTSHEKFFSGVSLAFEHVWLLY